MRRDIAFSLEPITLVDEAGIRKRIAALASRHGNTAAAMDAFFAVMAEFETAEAQLRTSLVETSLEWMDEEKGCAEFVHRSSDALAEVGFHIAQSGIAEWGFNDPRVLRLIARTLQFMGDTLKWEATLTNGAAHDLTKPHRLLRQALEAGQHRHEMSMRHDGLEWKATIEGLYFRALLLARYASGALNCKQIEILDAWLWTWMPALAGVSTPPAGAALRADLDSQHGLRRGPRDTEGASLYLPQGPIAQAYEHLLAEFQDGRIVPAVGTASRLRIEEHVQVLDLVRRGLRESMREPVARAERKPCFRAAVLLAGLGEIEDATRSRRRLVTITNESETGYGVEASEDACGSLAPGDLVAIRAEDGTSEAVAKVVRRVPMSADGRVKLGLRRLAAGMRLMPVLREIAGRPPGETVAAFVAGADPSGRHDAFLLSEQAYLLKPTFTATLGHRDYTLRLNRVRLRGRGWVLAGFEVISSQPKRARPRNPPKGSSGIAEGPQALFVA